MSPPILDLAALALASVAAIAALLSAVWSRSGAHKVDALAATVMPLLSRVKQKVDPDATVATVVAAAAAAPPPAIVEPAAPPSVSAVPLPLLRVEEDDERRESAPVHAGTLALEAAPGADGSEDTGRATMKMPAVDAHGAIVRRPPPPPPPPPAPPPPPDVAAVRRRAEEEAARFGAEDAEAAVLEAREQRQRADAARIAGMVEEAVRPSVEPDETTHVYSGRVDLGKLLPVVPAPRTPARVGRLMHASPGGPAKPPRAKLPSSPTLVSAGIAPGPRQRFDPRVEPDSRIEVTSPRRVR